MARALTLILGSTVLLGGCQQRVPEPEPAPEPVALPAATGSTPKGDRKKDEGKGGVKKVLVEDVSVGKGPAAKKGDTLVVHYTGRLEDGTKFDSSRDRDEPFEVKLGSGGVIQGWEEGLIGMKKGGKRKLTIPPEKGYGKRGSPPKIPPNATLVFDIELLEIK